MKYFRFSGKDPGSDSGSWYMVVKARYAVVALNLARRVLFKRGRSDLARSDFQLEDLGYCTEGVVAASIESIPESHFSKDFQMSVTFPVQYPQDMPLESARECFRIAFQDHSLDNERKAFALHGYAIFGYGLKVGIGEPTAMMAESASDPQIALPVELPEACSDEEAQSMLMSLSTEQDEGKFAALPINWLALAMWVIKMLRKKE